MADNIHCGITKLPKNKKLGTMKQCLEKNQVRLFGLNKIDPLLISNQQEKKRKANKEKDERMKLLLRVASIKGEIKFKNGAIEANK